MSRPAGLAADLRRRCRPHRSAPAQRGSATVLGVVLIGVLVSVAAMAAVLGSVIVDQRRVESAADLGALAGAAAAQRGEAGCVVAADVIRRNGARQDACHSDGPVVQVRASRQTGPLLGHRFTVASSARAGPDSTEVLDPAG